MDGWPASSFTHPTPKQWGNYAGKQAFLSLGWGWRDTPSPNSLQAHSWSQRLCCFQLGQGKPGGGACTQLPQSRKPLWSLRLANSHYVTPPPLLPGLSLSPHQCGGGGPSSSHPPWGHPLQARKTAALPDPSLPTPRNTIFSNGVRAQLWP